MLAIEAIQERLRLSLWFIPGIFGVAAFVLATVLLAIDRELSTDPSSIFFLFGGTAEGARNVLSTIAQSMLTFTGLVFTITMLVLQLASSQLSPRVMRTFLRDRNNQVVLGLFVATFLYTLLVLREVRTSTDAGGGFVPGLSIWVAFALLVASVFAFVYYIDHMAHAIRASTVIENIAKESREALERLFPDPVGREPEVEAAPVLAALGPGDAVLESERAGTIVGIDEDALLEAAAPAGRCAELIPTVGAYAPEGTPLFRLWGDWDEEAVGALRGGVEWGTDRTLQQDAAFGFRQLVDVALRALSPGINDPTTAVQVLDRVHDLLRRLAGRAVPSAVLVGEDGAPRLILHRPSWEDYLRLAVVEVRLAGSDQVQVIERLRVMLEDLLTVAPPHRQAILRRELQQLADAEVHGVAVGV